MLAKRLELPSVNTSKGGALNQNLYGQSVRAKSVLDSSTLTGAGLVVCTTGIRELHYTIPDQMDTTLDYILANTQAIANWWADMRPGTVMVVLPPVENGSGQQGMSRVVTEAFLSKLIYPAVALDWYQQDKLHDIGTPNSWWYNWDHPNTTGHVGMADAVISYLQQ
jgi:hypothetical protein